MDKILEALKKLLPENQVKDVTEAVSQYLAEAKAELEKEYNEKLQEAYAELSEEVKQNEQVAEEGYQQAYGIIQDLRQRLETQRAEFDAALEEGYEEAYQMLQAEKGKNDNSSAELYEEYDKKLAEMKEYMIDKVDQFLQYKGREIYEQAKRDIINDPRMVEHKVTLDKIVQLCGDYLAEEDYDLAVSGKLEEARKLAEDLRGKVRLLEAKNIRVATENNKLTEQLRQAGEIITESKQQTVTEGRKAREEKAQKVQGSGKKVTERVEVVAEYNEKPGNKKDVDTTLVESIDPAELHSMQVLSGLKSDS
jgi:hypothetical protein